MGRLFLAITFVFVWVPTAVSSTADLLAAVHEYVADFNKATRKRWQLVPTLLRS